MTPAERLRAAEEFAVAVLDGKCSFPDASAPEWCANHDWDRDEYANHCDIFVRTVDLIRARDAEVRADERAKVRYVVFDSDWVEPPGDVIAVFATKAEARAHIDGPGDGYGWSVVEVPAP